ncbi:MAG TPA: signal recognition particle protein [Candidatus Riflebacteria bacterium]|jgi:signal recognition particle subunit SRP54|nr:signal recognition particle protein [Candidatus Riflebacteria bacterium]
MFQGLSEKLASVFDKLRKSGKLTEKDVDTALNEVKMALLEADVNFKVVKNFTKRVKERCLGAEILKSLTPTQHVVKIVLEELTTLLGTDRAKINISSKKPTIILMAGLQGSGKTTTSAKLGLHLRKDEKKNPMLVACDIYRPAAIKQLQVLGDQLSMEVFTGEPGMRPADIAKKAIEHAVIRDFDVVIIDTAGRLHIDEQMMAEVKDIKEAVQPHEILLVVDSMTGQDAVNSATSFNELLELTGIILTKLDGDARGGAALSIREVTGKPVKFVGLGEKSSSLEPFYPERMAQRILGMGDVLSLIEKAQANMDEEKMKEIEKRVLDAEFNFNDFLYQLNQIKRMGPLDQLLGMIPGFSSAAGNLSEFSFDDKKFKRFEAIILSMTERERNSPDLIDGSRRKRISEGSGNSIQDVNQLLKQFAQMRKMMKQLGSLGKRNKGKFAKFFGM